MKTTRCFITIIAIFGFLKGYSQTDTSKLSNNAAVVDSSRQRDAIEILKKWLYKNTPANATRASRRLNFAIVPAVGYSLSNGFGLAVVSNVAFFTSTSHKENLSEITGELFYDTKAQKAFISRSEIWADKNNYKLVTDLIWEQYPEDTYGLGSNTNNSTKDHIDFIYVRTYATLFKRIAPDFYGGLGYNLDHHYNITEVGNADNTVSDFKKYGETPESTSSGVNFNLLYDSRRNPINPLNGAYASVSYRENDKFFGSDNNWQELRLDLRKYIRPSASSNNILAFWSILAFTNGNVPYLDLPSTGSDMYNNSGRGYARDRFRGKNLLYLESEYRFGITKNGLIGGVIFANGESLSGLQNNGFQKIAPAAGTGLRIKINKHSNTNICIDYGVGNNGSHGFFVNLGEFF